MNHAPRAIDATRALTGVTLLVLAAMLAACGPSTGRGLTGNNTTGPRPWTSTATVLSSCSRACSVASAMTILSILELSQQQGRPGSQTVADHAAVRYDRSWRRCRARPTRSWRRRGR